jgi:hypothetical protein
VLRELTNNQLLGVEAVEHETNSIYPLAQDSAEEVTRAIILGKMKHIPAPDRLCGNGLHEKTVLAGRW